MSLIGKLCAFKGSWLFSEKIMIIAKSINGPVSNSGISLFMPIPKLNLRKDTDTLLNDDLSIITEQQYALGCIHFGAKR